jgi:hypothetical protein
MRFLAFLIRLEFAFNSPLTSILKHKVCYFDRQSCGLASQDSGAVQHFSERPCLIQLRSTSHHWENEKGGPLLQLIADRAWQLQDFDVKCREMREVGRWFGLGQALILDVVPTFNQLSTIITKIVNPILETLEIIKTTKMGQLISTYWSSWGENSLSATFKIDGRKGNLKVNRLYEGPLQWR